MRVDWDNDRDLLSEPFSMWTGSLYQGCSLSVSLSHSLSLSLTRSLSLMLSLSHSLSCLLSFTRTCIYLCVGIQGALFIYN